MSAAPFFSVIVATYNRGAAIIPTIRSALAQTEQDFELLVVGDGCTDDTGDIVHSLGSPKVSWRNLPKNGGSQSFANNAGIEAARGKWICYLGHDDIWSEDHLAELKKVILSDPELGFVASGCIVHGSEGIGPLFVTGFLDSKHTAAEHFIPPSSFAHRRDVTDRIGFWLAPETIRHPVDGDFILRCVDAGVKFGATGNVTVHKFAAGHRYLSYLKQDDEEQNAVLALPADVLRERSVQMVEQVKARGRFMIIRHRQDPPEPGALYRENMRRKGLAVPALTPLGKEKVLEQTPESRALDWFDVQDAPPKFRVSGPNPNPKILIPFTGGDVEFFLHIVRRPEHPEGRAIRVRVNGIERSARYAKDRQGSDELRFFGKLLQDYPTVISLHIPAPVNGREGGPDDWYRYGIGIGPIRIKRLGIAGKIRKHFTRQ